LFPADVCFPQMFFSHRYFFPQIFAEEPQISQSAFGWVIQKENKKIRVIRVIRVP
jgi:hypothetical protein